MDSKWISKRLTKNLTILTLNLMIIKLKVKILDKIGTLFVEFLKNLNWSNKM